MWKKVFISAVAIFIVGIGSYFVLHQTTATRQNSDQIVLGETLETTSQVTGEPNQTPLTKVLSPIGTTEPVPTRLAVSDQFEVMLVNGPTEIIENSNATFTWQITGPARTIHTTTIYWGPVSTPGGLTTSMEASRTKYTNTVLDFMDGNFAIPLRFIGNSIASSPGTYYYRAYALIDGKHYWSSEKSFVVKPEPKHEIKIVNPPEKLSTGENATFTWDVYGPSATTWFTAIVAGKQSKPGELDSATDIPKTPYGVLVNEFTTGPYTVPLRFIGNAKLTEPGVYFFRALSFINNKNIWSDEYSLTVE